MANHNNSCFPDLSSHEVRALLLRAFFLIGFLWLVASACQGMETLVYRNGGSNAAAENGHNNGADTANVSLYLSGWVTAASGTGLYTNTQANNNVLVPSDFTGNNNYESSYWTAQRSTMIGEAVALRLEVVELRRLIVAMGGIFFGFNVCKYLFKWV